MTWKTIFSLFLPACSPIGPARMFKVAGYDLLWFFLLIIMQLRFYSYKKLHRIVALGVLTGCASVLRQNLEGGLQMQEDSPWQHKKPLSSMHNLPLLHLMAWEERSTVMFVASSPNALAENQTAEFIDVLFVVKCIVVSVRLLFSSACFIFFRWD